MVLCRLTGLGGGGDDGGSSSEGDSSGSEEDVGGEEGGGREGGRLEGRPITFQSLWESLTVEEGMQVWLWHTCSTRQPRARQGRLRNARPALESNARLRWCRGRPGAAPTPSGALLASSPAARARRPG